MIGKYVWIILDYEFSDTLRKPMRLFFTNCRNLKIADVVKISKLGYIIKSKGEDKIGYFCKYGKNITIKQKHILFVKVYGMIIKRIWG